MVTEHLAFNWEITMKFRLVSLLALAVSFGAEAENWYRGNLHAHSLWSDGNVFPEDAAAWYRDNGYQFLCLSDHQALQIDPNASVEIGSKKLSRLQADRYISSHPASAEVKKEGGKEFMKLKTVWELKRLFDQPESFLMVPGHELNQVIGGLQVHMNAVNVNDTIAFRYGSTPSETFMRIDDAVRQWGAEQEVPTLVMLNHPTWPYFDILPEVLIGLPQIRFFELCNVDGGPSFPANPAWYSMEKFWDIVNAFRVEDGFDPVFGTATDDAHNYTDTKGPARPGEGWICVRAARLAPDALVQAMYRGDFYASTGVTLADLTFDADTGTLKVKVKPEAGLHYDIRFVATKAGFDRTTEAFNDPAKDKKPGRKGVRYSDAIGKTMKSEDATEASYKMEADDLYVRAAVTSSKRTTNRLSNEPEYETAWTQPYGWRLWQARNPERAHLAAPKK